MGRLGVEKDVIKTGKDVTFKAKNNYKEWLRVVGDPIEGNTCSAPNYCDCEWKQCPMIWGNTFVCETCYLNMVQNGG